MNKQPLIVITGAAGFIGSCMVQSLNAKGYTNLLLVDKFNPSQQQANWQTKVYSSIVDRDDFFTWLNSCENEVSFIIHLGANTDTTESDYSIHQKQNLEYSKSIWNYCAIAGIPLIYASSAATYGAGEHGFDDDHGLVEKLKPLNPYGISKNEFDKWAIVQQISPVYWAGLKFFNVYGPNENHKGRMASVVWHAFNQIQTARCMKLFKSYLQEFKDGEQLRDFVYVKDLLNIINWMMDCMNDNTWQKTKNGLYNIGSGKARSFNDLVKGVFNAMDEEIIIEYIPMPEDIKEKYQYFTEANISKLRDAGYTDELYTLEEGVYDYVKNYLKTDKHF
jgi:ADP-L-glycero-D-manno-heptose 6-epimerase